MKNTILERKLQDEVLDFVHARQSLMLASTGEDGLPYASYAPFALGNACLYVLISDVAIHAQNLRRNPAASVLLIEDELRSRDIFARIRVSYRVEASVLDRNSADWFEGIALLGLRLGERINQLSTLADFHLFRLSPKGGRYVKGFGRAYQIRGNSLVGEAVDHLREGHREPAAS